MGVVCLVGLALLGAAAPASADPLQFWLPSNLVVQVADRWALALGMEPRWEDGDRSAERLLIRPAVIFEPVSGLTVWAGYGDTEVRSGAGRDDQMLWQQATYTMALRSWTVVPRVRTEQRFVDGTDSTGWRVRTQLRVMRRLPVFGRWNLVASHESFMAMNDVPTSQRSGYLEGRYLVGVQRKVTPWLTVEPGFLWRFNNRPAPLPDSWDRVISVNTLVRF